MNKFLSLITAFFLVSTTCLAGEVDDKSIAQIFLQASETGSSVGFIDGKKYLAALVFDEKAQSTALVVFELDKKGGYKLLAKSGGSGLDPLRWYNRSVKIKNNSVYFSVAGNGGCCSDFFEKYQLKLQNGKFSLVGIESSTIGFEPRNDRNGIAIQGRFVSYSYGSSINYLTGVVSHWRIQAPSSSENPFKDDISMIRKGKKRIENRFNFVPTKMVLLDGFDVWADSDGESKHLAGFFDQNFKYQE